MDFCREVKRLTHLPNGLIDWIQVNPNITKMPERQYGNQTIIQKIRKINKGISTVQYHPNP
jgi:hypothetical protein